MTQGEQTALTLLHDIEQRCKKNAFDLPQQVEIRTTWDGIGFRIGDLRMVTPLAQVKEILMQAQVTVVPGAQSWVRGIANIRGNLLPIMDLMGMLTGNGSKWGRGSRILVVQHNGVGAGLLVDEVFGMRHFFDEERVEEIPTMAAGIAPMVNAVFKQGGEYWPVFDFHSLVESPDFMKVAA